MSTWPNCLEPLLRGCGIFSLYLIFHGLTFFLKIRGTHFSRKEVSLKSYFKPFKYLFGLTVFGNGAPQWLTPGVRKFPVQISTVKIVFLEIFSRTIYSTVYSLIFQMKITKISFIGDYKLKTYRVQKTSVTSNQSPHFILHLAPTRA